MPMEHEKFKSRKLNLGCGVWLRKGYINVDNYFTLEDLKGKKGQFLNAKIDKGAEFLQADVRKLPLPSDFAEHVEMHQTLEHINMHQIVDTLKEVRRVMKPGAKLIIDVPFFTGLAIDWLEMVSSQEFDPAKYYDVAETIFGNQYADSHGEVHKTPFTPQFMNFCLYNAGFEKGEMVIIPKGAKVPAIGELAKADKKSVTRNALLVVEAVK